MTPRPSATASKQAQESKASPFEQIAELEKSEALRLQEAIEKLQNERIDAEKGMHDAQKHAEEKLREEAMKYLTDRKEEIGKELEKNEESVKDELKTIESSFKKNAPALVGKQSEALLLLAL